MKEIMFCLVLATSPAFAQSSESVPTAPPAAPSVAVAPLKNDNTITVTLLNSGLEAWTQVAQAMVNTGFKLGDSDRKELTITTEPKFRNSTMYVRIAAKVTGSTVQLTGTYTMLKTDAKREDIVFKNAKKGPQAIGWQELLEVANSLHGNAVSYSRQ